MPGREGSSSSNEQEDRSSEEISKAKRSMSAEQLSVLNDPGKRRNRKEFTGFDLSTLLAPNGGQTIDFLSDFVDYVAEFRGKRYAVAYRLLEGWSYEEIQEMEVVSPNLVSEVVERLRRWAARYRRD